MSQTLTNLIYVYVNVYVCVQEPPSPCHSPTPQRGPAPADTAADGRGRRYCALRWVCTNTFGALVEASVAISTAGASTQVVLEANAIAVIVDRRTLESTRHAPKVAVRLTALLAAFVTRLTAWFASWLAAVLPRPLAATLGVPPLVPLTIRGFLELSYLFPELVDFLLGCGGAG